MFDTGNTAFMFVAACLVMFMTPGLAFFYGGLVGRKNVLTIMTQSFVSMGLTTVIWFIIGWSLCFSGDIGGIIGDFSQSFLNGISTSSAWSKDNNIPTFVVVVFQMMFAIITPALITGAFANRVRFKAYLLFLVGWLLLVYFPFVHMVWSDNGILKLWGVQDFAGGIVVHNIAGMAALASVLYVGKRRSPDHVHSVPFIALGTGILWFGWYGFNAGSQMKCDATAMLAFINTDVAASFAAIGWLFVAWIFEEKPKFVGLLTGAVAGLATITPAAGYVSTTSAAIIGIVASVVCYLAIRVKNKFNWDDALDVWGVHGVGGMIGIIMLGILGSHLVNADGKDGLLYGGYTFFYKQVAAVVISSIYAFAVTYGMLVVINKITPVKVEQAEEEKGLDESLHGEQAYI